MGKITTGVALWVHFWINIFQANHKYCIVKPREHQPFSVPPGEYDGQFPTQQNSTGPQHGARLAAIAGGATDQRMRDNWTVVDGNSLLFAFGSKELDARKALCVIKKYGFTKACFVGRPGPSMIYLRK